MPRKRRMPDPDPAAVVAAAPDADVAAFPVASVDVGLPPDEDEAGADPVAVAVPAPERPPALPLAQGATPDPDVPWDPLPPGSLADLIETTDPDAARRMRAADRAARGEAEPEPEAGNVRAQARAAVACVLPGIIQAAADSGLDVRDRVAAVRELAKLSGLADEAAPVAVTRTWDELERAWDACVRARAERVARAATLGGQVRQPGV